MQNSHYGGVIKQIDGGLARVCHYFTAFGSANAHESYVSHNALTGNLEALPHSLDAWVRELGDQPTAEGGAR